MDKDKKKSHSESKSIFASVVTPWIWRFTERAPKSTKQDRFEALWLCQMCRNVLDKKYCCAKCNYVYYCSTECQTKDWKLHQKTCSTTLKEFKSFFKQISRDSYLYALTVWLAAFLYNHIELTRILSVICVNEKTYIFGSVDISGAPKERRLHFYPIALYSKTSKARIACIPALPLFIMDVNVATTYGKIQKIRSALEPLAFDALLDWKCKILFSGKTKEKEQ